MNKKNLTVLWQTGLALVQIITGAGLMMFLITHMLGTSTINFGTKLFDWYGTHLDHAQLLVKIAVWLVLVALLTHGLNGLRIILRYLRKTPDVHRFVGKSGYRESFLWYVFFLTGIVMFITVNFHVVMTYFLPTESAITASAVISRLQNNDWYFAMMFVFLLSTIFHSLFGTRAILIYLGLFTRHLHKVEVVLLVLGLALAVLGVNNLILFRMGE